MNHYQQRKLETFAATVAARKTDTTRHKCFVSYHAEDTQEVVSFISEFGTEFIAKTVGVTEEDDFIDSSNTEYIMDQIRTKYLGDSSITIVLVGKCTWARRYVDWELYSSLRRSKHSSVNGLVAIQLPSVAQENPKLPARLSDNIIRDAHNSEVGYGRYYSYPTSKVSLRNWLGDAYAARTSRQPLIINSRTRRVRSATC